jgi:hypothetical protein
MDTIEREREREREWGGVEWLDVAQDRGPVEGSFKKR